MADSETPAIKRKWFATAAPVGGIICAAAVAAIATLSVDLATITEKTLSVLRELSMEETRLLTISDATDITGDIYYSHIAVNFAVTKKGDQPRCTPQLLVSNGVKNPQWNDDATGTIRQGTVNFLEFAEELKQEIFTSYFPIDDADGITRKTQFKLRLSCDRSIISNLVPVARL
jgi:hypothetical protein